MDHNKQYQDTTAHGTGQHAGFGDGDKFTHNDPNKKGAVKGTVDNIGQKANEFAGKVGEMGQKVKQGTVDKVGGGQKHNNDVHGQGIHGHGVQGGQGILHGQGGQDILHGQQGGLHGQQGGLHGQQGGLHGQQGGGLQGQQGKYGDQQYVNK